MGCIIQMQNLVPLCDRRTKGEDIQLKYIIRKNYLTKDFTICILHLILLQWLN